MDEKRPRVRRGLFLCGQFAVEMSLALDQYGFRVLPVDLEAVAGGVGDNHPVVLSDLHGARRPEHPLRSEISDAVALPDHLGIGPELGDAHLGKAAVPRASA